MGQIVSIIPAVFVLGAILLLERRCLGKTALVQPLVLCLLGGVFTGEESTGLWLGVSMQLLSIGQSHYCNWVFAATVSTGSLVVLDLYDIHFVPGSPASIVLILVSILLGIISDSAERRATRGGPQVLQDSELWRSEQVMDAFASLIKKRILRGFILGGFQSMVGVALAASMVFIVQEKLNPELHPRMPVVVALAVPLFGVAVTLGSLSGRRYPFFATIGILISTGVWVLL